MSVTESEIARIRHNIPFNPYTPLPPCTKKKKTNKTKFQEMAFFSLTK
jgi:hypothetical protein